jgi:hypothetical protein
MMIDTMAQARDQTASQFLIQQLQAEIDAKQGQPPLKRRPSTPERYKNAPKNMRPPQSPVQKAEPGTPSSASSQIKRPALMKLDKETINDIVELKNRYREKLSENFELPGFPYYNNNMYTEDGQPYYSMFLSNDKHKLKTHRSEEEMIQDTNSDVPRGVAHHLYADGVLKVSFE